MAQKVIHYSNGGIVCGANTNWRSRGHTFQHLSWTTDKDKVTCKNCLRHWTIKLY